METRGRNRGSKARANGVTWVVSHLLLRAVPGELGQGSTCPLSGDSVSSGMKRWHIRVIKTGGKQYRVSPGDVVQVEKLSAAPGEAVEITDVFMLVKDEDVAIGNPTVANVRVIAEVVTQARGEKIRIFKSDAASITRNDRPSPVLLGDPDCRDRRWRQELPGRRCRCIAVGIGRREQGSGIAGSSARPRA